MTSRLLAATPARRLAFQRMAQDWRDHGKDLYALALDDFDAYMARLEQLADAARVPEGWVPGAHFWLESDGEIMACVRLRFGLTPMLEREGGQIGYDVRPSARNRGFASAALRLVLPEAQRRGLDPVLVTVDDDNPASIRVIEKNGGTLENTVTSELDGKCVRRYWLRTSL